MLQATAETKDILKKIGSSDPSVSSQGMNELKAAISEPVNRAVFDGDNTDKIFVAIDAPEDGGSVKFPKDVVAAGSEDDYVAYTMPMSGAKVPERHAEGNETRVPTYRVANAIDWDLSYARNSRIDVISRYIEVFQAGFVKKNNDDGWKTIITAAAQKGTMYIDAAATSGVFTKQALSDMIVGFDRFGGNATSLWNFKCTDIFMSPEGMADIRDWKIHASTDYIDDTTAREIEQNGGLAMLFGVIINKDKEFGKYQNYQATIYNNVSGKTAMGSADQEIFIGLDLDPKKRASTFVRPVNEALSMWEDTSLHRQGRQGFYGWTVVGTGLLDTRCCAVGSF